MTDKRKRNSKTESSSDNKTLQRLAGTPFKNAKEMNEAKERIFMECWEDLTKAQAFHVMTQKDEFKFYLDKFEKGMKCRYGSDAEDIVAINIDDGGALIVAINEELKKKGHSEKFVSALAQALSNSFYSNYLRAMRALPVDVDEAEVKKAKKFLEDKGLT